MDYKFLFSFFCILSFFLKDNNFAHVFWDKKSLFKEEKTEVFHLINELGLLDKFWIRIIQQLQTDS